jgi:hypothetical protein
MWKKYSSTYPAKSAWLLDVFLNRVKKHPGCEPYFPKNCCGIVVAGILVERRKECMIGDRKHLTDLGICFTETKPWSDNWEHLVVDMDNYKEEYKDKKDIWSV